MLRFFFVLSIIFTLSSANDDSVDMSNYDDLDSFLSDLPHKMPEILEQTTEPPMTTMDPPPAQCFRNNKPMVFPPNLFSNKSVHYPFQESGLQIFLGMKIPCDGVITAWQFLSAHTVIWGLHFGIFRRTCFDVFQLVSDTYINGQTTGTVEEKWVAWKPANPIPVKRGDVIGIFYDKVNTATKQVAVRSVTLPDNYKYAPKQFARSEALVFLSDAQALAKSHGCVRLGSGRVTRRIPALFLLMTPEIRGRLVQNRASSTTTLEPTTPPQAEKVQPDNLLPLNGAGDCNQLPKFDYSCDISLGVRYYYDKISKVCRQFLYCPTSAAASAFGFASQSDCVHQCATKTGQVTPVAHGRDGDNSGISAITSSQQTPAHRPSRPSKTGKPSARRSQNVVSRVGGLSSAFLNSIKSQRISTTPANSGEQGQQDDHILVRKNNGEQKSSRMEQGSSELVPRNRAVGGDSDEETLPFTLPPAAIADHRRSSSIASPQPQASSSNHGKRPTPSPRSRQLSRRQYNRMVQNRRRSVPYEVDEQETKSQTAGRFYA